MPAESLNGSMTLPIEGTGYEVGVQVNENGIVVSAQPSDEPPTDVPDDDRPAPTIAPPPGPPANDDEPPEDEQ